MIVWPSVHLNLQILNPKHKDWQSKKGYHLRERERGKRKEEKERENRMIDPSVYSIIQSEWFFFPSINHHQNLSYSNGNVFLFMSTWFFFFSYKCFVNVEDLWKDYFLVYKICSSPSPSPAPAPFEIDIIIFFSSNNLKNFYIPLTPSTYLSDHIVFWQMFEKILALAKSL